MKLTHHAIALFALVAPLAASEVANGSVWTTSDGGYSATANVTQDSTANSASVSFTDGTGTSGTATGTLGPSSSESSPTVTESGQASTPGPNGATLRVKEGKVQKRNADGSWSNMRKKKKTTSQQDSSFYLQAGQASPVGGILRSPTHPDIALQRGDVAPWDGWITSSPGEEVVSLPG